jgi:hypothetical protein
MGATMSFVRQLRSTVQDWVTRLSPGRRAKYRKILQDYSQVLTTRVDLPRLVLTMAEQVEEVLQPSDLPSK